MSNGMHPIATTSEGEIVLYQPNDNIRLDVRIEDETVWLTQQQMQKLFDSSKANISEHIANIYEQGELTPEATVRKFRTVRIEGGRKVNRNLDHYNLDMIISVGYRVKSLVGVRFRQWATTTLKQHLLRGSRLTSSYAPTNRLLKASSTKDRCLMHATLPKHS